MKRDWSPVGVPLWGAFGTEPPEVGALVANDRKLYRVVSITERHQANWDDYDREQYTKDLEYRDRARQQLARAAALRLQNSRRNEEIIAWDGRLETWPSRPQAVVLQSLPAGKRRHVRWPHPAWVSWYPMDEHHAICASCGELYPCREIEAAKQASREMQSAERLMSISPGCCWHCQEPITRRQGSREFDGENLLLPGGPPPVFHTRRDKGCWDAAYQYEKRWRAASPARVDEPSLFPGEPWERP